MFENNKDLSRGLSRSENQPAESYPEISSPPIYTAYTQPAESLQDAEYSARNIPPAAPPPQDTEEIQSEKPRKRSHKLAAFFIVLAVLFIVVGLFVLRYEINISTGKSGISISVEPRSKASSEMQNVPVKPGSTYPGSNDTSAVLSPSGGAGLDVELQIANRPVLANGELSFKEIYSICAPSIAAISAETYSGSFSGTGIVMRSDGYIITNAHVIDGAYEIKVSFENGNEYEAVIVGSDSMSDLAVLKIDASSLTAAEFGNSETLSVGDEVVAIGNPFDQNLTMTNGIISAINRDVTYNGSTMTLLQTNAAINEGNSGGALINMYGQVIGITNMKLISYYTSIEGIGYAIPSATAKAVVDELLDHGYVAGRPGIGVTLEEVPDSARAYYGLPKGLYVREVQENSNAYEEGIRVGDMITAINGVAVTTNSEASEIKNQYGVGDSISITVYRNGVSFDVAVKLMDMGEFN